MPLHFVVSSADSNLAEIEVGNDLKSFTVTGSVSEQLTTFLNSKQTFNIGKLGETGEMIVEETPTSNPALLQRALLKIPSVLRTYGQVKIDGPWKMFLKS